MPAWVSVLTLLVACSHQAFASCAHGTHLHPRAERGVIEAPKFGYVATKASANWFSLDPQANVLCGHGKHQSPINMEKGSFDLIPASELKIDIPDFTEGAELNSRTLERPSKLLRRGLAQFHFHLPSEHLNNGTSMAMEMHMVWTSEEVEIAVIGVYIDLYDGFSAAQHEGNAAGRKALRDHRQVNATTPSAVVATVLGSVDKIATLGDVTHTEPLAMSELVSLLSSGSFQSYSGSLTTPPCSDGVKWLVSNKKVSISTSTYLKARPVIGYNARFPQNAPGQENLLNLYAENAEAYRAVQVQ
ncbi:tat pathway signal sequence [Fusarium oxysporum f. sp. phaseoli]